MKKQKLYRYLVPTKEGEKMPLVLMYANNQAHAVQLFAERYNKKIDKNLVVEYIEPPKKEKNKDNNRNNNRNQNRNQSRNQNNNNNQNRSQKTK